LFVFNPSALPEALAAEQANHLVIARLVARSSNEEQPLEALLKL